MTRTKSKFSLGQLVLTRAVNDLVANSTSFSLVVTRSLNRHQQGDWGDVCPDDKQANHEALAHGDLRLFSVYTSPRHLPLDPVTIWIITEADRSATTVLFPEDY